MRATAACTIGGWLGCGSGICDIALHMRSRLSPATCRRCPPPPPPCTPAVRAPYVRDSVIFSLLPRTLQSVVPGSPPDGPVLGLMPCLFLPRMLQPGAPFFFFFVFSQLPRTLQSVAPGLPPDDPVRGLAPCFIPPGCSNLGRLFVALSLPQSALSPSSSPLHFPRFLFRPTTLRAQSRTLHSMRLALPLSLSLRSPS